MTVAAVAKHDDGNSTIDYCYCCTVIDFVACDDADGDYAEACSP